MTNIEILIFVLLAALFLFDLYVLYKIYDFGWKIYRIFVESSQDLML